MGVGAEELGGEGVIDSSVHVDDLEGVQVFVAGVAAVVEPRGGCVVDLCPVLGIAVTTPGVVGSAFHYRSALVGPCYQRTLVIVISVIQGLGGTLLQHHRTAAKIMDFLNCSIRFIHFFVIAQIITGSCGRALSKDRLSALVVHTVAYFVKLVTPPTPKLILSLVSLALSLPGDGTKGNKEYFV